MSEWKKMSISTATSINPSIPLIRGQEYLFVDMASIDPSSKCVFAREARRFDGGGSRFTVGDTLMARITPCLENGKIARFCGEVESLAHGSTEFIVIRGREGITTTDYAYYLVKWDKVRSYAISQMSGTSGRQRFPLSAFDHIYIPIPPLLEQKTIASILSSLDDKIELNRRMNETLEAMARAIFKDWFVDFGPTRAKQEGRAAYLPEHLWSLFPEAIDRETGLPIGWEEVTLNHHIQFNPSESLKKGTEAPYLGMNALPTQGSISDPPVLREFTSGMRFRNGDTLFARITPCLENGKTAFVQNLASNEIGWGSTEFIVMRSIFPVPKVFSYLIARDPSFRAVAIQSMTGTSGRQRARTEALENYIFCNPKTTTIWECLGSVLNPMFDKIASHDLESRTLAEMRDRLLPKLMSGEIRVKDAEKIVEEVM